MISQTFLTLSLSLFLSLCLSLSLYLSLPLPLSLSHTFSLSLPPFLSLLLSSSPSLSVSLSLSHTGVSAIIFVASISEYDQCLYEDCATNRAVSTARISSLLHVLHLHCSQLYSHLYLTSIFDLSSVPFLNFFT